MRRLLFVMLCMTGFWVMAIAQKVTVSGTVKDANGAPVAGASVREKGTRNGTVANDAGAFTLSVAQGARLVITATGFGEMEVASNGNLNIQLAEKASDLSEVVVTALGITKEKRSLGYSAQTVAPDQLNKVRPTDISQALAGKVAGLQVLGTPGSNFGEGNVRLRGVSSIDAQNPIYVVDGTIINLSAINLDEIENVTVLKGPSATALYGVRAAGGAIELQLRKGARNRKSTVTVNSLTEIGNVSLLPKYQNEYGGGYSQDWQTFTFNPAVHPASWAAFNGHKLVEYGADESWGPRMDGTLVREWFSWYPGEDFGKLTPFSPNPNNVKDFYERSTRLNNNIAFEGGGDNTTFRLSYNNRYTTLPFPNTKNIENLLAFRGSINVTSKLTIATNLNLNTAFQKNLQSEGYRNDGKNIGQNFNQWWQRQLDINQLRNYKNPAGGFRTWNIRSPIDLRPAYWDNPFFQVYESGNRAEDNRLYGDINVSYKILPELKASVITRANFLNYFSDARTATGGLELDAYSITNGQFSEFNYEGRLEYNKRFGNFGVRQLLGGNLMNQNRRQNNGATVGGLSVPNLYSLTASRDRPSVGNSWLDYRINSAFANGGLDYKNMIFVDWSVRNDWVSSLPENLRSYLYPSVATSFVFSDLLGRSFKNVLSFGKLRAAYGQSGQAPAAYTLNLAYGLGQPYGANPTMSVPTTVYDPAIKPALTNEIEVGTELQFFKNRLGVDFTWYQKNGKDQIIPLGVTPSSGSGTVWINAGLLRSQGWDLVLNGSPIKSRNWNLDIQLNLSRNISTTLDLDTAKNLRNRSLGAAAFGPSVNARVGERYGTFVGTRNLIDDKTGLPVINAAGNWVRQQNQILGNALPEFMGGGVANLSYKNWSLSTTFSFQKGGMFFSTTRLFTLYSGLVEETVGLNDKGNPKRDAPSAGGGVRVDGVLANGTPTTVYVDAQTYYGNMFGVHNFFLQEASYVKLAEARISYTLPAGKLIKGMKPATISFISRNPWLIWAPAKDWGVDPSEIENFNQFFEGGQLPPVRSFGLNISFGF